MPALSRPARGASLVLLALAAGACSPAQSPASTGTPGASPSAPAATTIVLDRAPANLGCDTIGVGYRSITFFIDPTQTPMVWAVTDRGERLGVKWDDSFTGAPIASPGVLDKSGAIVASNGEVLLIPQAAWPNLHGHFVCPSTETVFVLDQAPS